MAHWKSMMEKEYLYAFDLQGRDVTVEIDRIVGGELTGEGGKKTKKPVAWFVGKKKPLALNATNCKTIARLYGSNDVKDWVGKRITLWPTTTTFGSDTVDCIRIRPEIPPPAKSGNAGRAQAPATDKSDVDAAADRDAEGGDS